MPWLFFLVTVLLVLNFCDPWESAITSQLLLPVLCRMLYRTEKRVIRGGHTAKAYGDDTSCFPTSLRLRLVAQQRGTLSPAKFGRTFGGEVLLQAMLVPPQLPWPCLPHWLSSRCVPDDYSPAAFHTSWNLSWKLILELPCPLNGTGVGKGLLLSEGYNPNMRERETKKSLHRKGFFSSSVIRPALKPLFSLSPNIILNFLFLILFTIWFAEEEGGELIFSFPQYLFLQNCEEKWRGSIDNKSIWLSKC